MKYNSSSDFLFSAISYLAHDERSSTNDLQSDNYPLLGYVGEEKSTESRIQETIFTSRSFALFPHLLNFILTVAGVSAVVLLLRSDMKQSAFLFRRNVCHIRN
ncbi:hypothetical protein ACS0TY_007214 [Phlomoides rotata]